MATSPMSNGDPMSGAVWCDQHNRRECSRNSQRTKQRCHNIAIRGMNACRNHVGKRRDLAKAQGEAITAWNAMGGKPDVSHTEIVLSMMQMAYLRWHVYADLLRRQVEQDGGQPELGRSEVDEVDGKPGIGSENAGSGTSGLIGHTYSGVKDIGIFATGEAVRALVKLEAEWADRAVKFAKTAHDMGVDDAVVDVIRRQADQVQALLQAVLSRLGHDWADPVVVTAVEAALVEIEGGEAA